MSAQAAAASQRPWWSYVEPWAGAYALLGFTVSGGLPMMLPLAVDRSGSAAEVGLVMASLSLGTVMSPVCGALADRYRIHRILLTAGILLTGIAVALLAWTTGAAPRAGLAFAAGCGSAAASTVAYLFVVEAHPRGEWPHRFGALQLIYVAAQVLGLIFAGLISRIDLRAGFIADGGVAMAAALVAWLSTRRRRYATGVGFARPVPGTPNPPIAQHPPVMRVEHALGVHRGWHLPNGAILRRVAASPFAIFLGVWVLAFTGSSTFFALYPVFMARVFHIGPSRSSLAYAAAVGLSLTLFSPAARWANDLGAGRLVRVGIQIRLLALLVIAGLSVLGGATGALGAVVAFAALVLAWALLGVSGPPLAARRSPVGEGEGMGLYNAAGAAGGVLGGLLSGWAAQTWGYVAIPLAGAACLGAALLLTTADPTWGRKLTPPAVPAPNG